MFSRKYVFETHGTKFRRRFLFGLFLLGILFLLYSILCLCFIFISAKESEKTLNHLQSNPPNLIAVFTGDKGRIKYGLKVGENFPDAKFLITGVNDTHTASSLLKIYAPNKTQEFADDRIVIDYLASNTIENVFFTLRYIKKNPDFKNVLIISSDYHITRIKVIINRMHGPLSPNQFHYLGLKRDYKKFRNLKILAKEVFKLMKTFSFLLLWDHEDYQNID